MVPLHFSLSLSLLQLATCFTLQTCFCQSYESRSQNKSSPVPILYWTLTSAQRRDVSLRKKRLFKSWFVKNTKLWNLILFKRPTQRYICNNLSLWNFSHAGTYIGVILCVVLNITSEHTRRIRQFRRYEISWGKKEQGDKKKHSVSQKKANLTVFSTSFKSVSKSCQQH